MNKSPLFRKWLFAQAGTGTPIGDLASDLRADRTIPLSSFHFMDFIIAVGAEPGLQSILFDAYAQFVNEYPDGKTFTLCTDNFAKQGKSMTMNAECDACGEPVSEVRDAGIEWHKESGIITQWAVFHAEPEREILKSPCRQLYNAQRLSELTFPTRDSHFSMEAIILYDCIQADDPKLAFIGMRPIIQTVAWLRQEALADFTTPEIRRVAPKREAHSPLSITNSRRFDIMTRDSFRCCLCGATAATGATLEIDHRHPKSLGGSNADENLWTLCFECNRGKCAKLVDFKSHKI